MSRRTPTFRCLSQPLLTAGCERTPAVLVIGSGFLCAVMAWFSWSPLALGTAVFLFVVGIPFLQQLAKRDPKMVEIAFRFSRYHRHYPAYVCRRPERRLPVKLIATTAVLAAAAAWWWL